LPFFYPILSSKKPIIVDSLADLEVIEITYNIISQFQIHEIDFGCFGNLLFTIFVKIDYPISTSYSFKNSFPLTEMRSTLY